MHYRSGRTYTHTHTTPRHFPPSLPPFLPFSPFFSFVCRYIVIRDASVADWFEALVRSIADFSSGVDGSGALHPPSGVGQPQQQQQLAVDSVHVAVVVVMWLWLCGCACVHVVVVVSPLIPSSKLSLSPPPSPPPRFPHRTPLPRACQCRPTTAQLFCATSNRSSVTGRTFRMCTCLQGLATARRQSCRRTPGCTRWCRSVLCSSDQGMCVCV